MNARNIGLTLLLVVVVVGCSESREDKYIRLKEELGTIKSTQITLFAKAGNIVDAFRESRGYKYDTSFVEDPDAPEVSIRVDATGAEVGIGEEGEYIVNPKIDEYNKKEYARIEKLYAYNRKIDSDWENSESEERQEYDRLMDKRGELEQESYELKIQIDALEKT